MSLVRQCDCDCHEDWLAPIDEFEQWATFGGKDVCQWCLDGCRRWNPHVVPEPTRLQEMVRMAYEQTILESLRSEPLFAGLVKKEPPATTTGGS